MGAFRGRLSPYSKRMTVNELRRAIITERAIDPNDWTRVRTEAERIVMGARRSTYGMFDHGKRVNLKQVYWYMASTCPEKCREVFGAVVPYSGAILPCGLKV